MNHKPLIIIPTYNEKGNVVKIYNDIRSLEIDLDILIDGFDNHQICIYI